MHPRLKTILAPRRCFTQFKPDWANPKIDSGHPLSRGLLFYAFDKGGTVVDLAGGIPMRAGTLTAAPTSQGQYGKGILYNSSDFKLFTSSPAIQAATAVDGWTAACGYVQTGNMASGGSPFLRQANSGGSQPFTNWELNVQDGGTAANCKGYYASGGFQVNSETAWTGNAQNVYTTLAHQAKSGAFSGIWAQGVNVALESKGAPQSVNTGDDIFMGSAGFTGYVYWGAFWNRTLSAAEHLLLHNQPYCFLRG